MNIGDFDMESINSVLAGMSKEDMDALKNLAGSFLSGNNQADGKEDAEEKPVNDEKPESNGFPDIDMETMAKIASVLQLMNSKKSDPRIDLINALEPLLQGEHKQRAKQAVQMLRLISILPLIKDIG